MSTKKKSRGPQKTVDTRNNKIINPFRQEAKGNMRSKDTIKRLAMYKTREKRDKQGRFVHGFLMNRKPDEVVKRVQPDRRWFGASSFVCLFRFCLPSA
jgi:hypothetical protein